MVAVPGRADVLAGVDEMGDIFAPVLTLKQELPLPSGWPDIDLGGRAGII